MEFLSYLFLPRPCSYIKMTSLLDVLLPYSCCSFLPSWDWKMLKWINTLGGSSSSSLRSFLPLCYLRSVSSSALCQHLAVPLRLHTAWLEQSWRLAKAALSNWRPSGEAEDTSDSGEGVESRERRGEIGLDIQALITMDLHNLNKCKCNIYFTWLLGGYWELPYL